MRHRIGIVLGVAMLAALFFAGAWGYLRLLRVPAVGSQLTGLPDGGGHILSDNRAVTALIAVAATGLLAGILIAMPRISPLAAGLPGLVLLGWTALYLVSVRQAVDLIPLRSDAFGAGFEAMLYNGTLAAAGLAMVVPMVIPSRWRRRAPDTDDAFGPFPVTETNPLARTPVFQPSSVIQPSAVITTVPATRMERVATGPAPISQPGHESIWVVGQRASGGAAADEPDGYGDEQD